MRLFSLVFLLAVSLISSAVASPERGYCLQVATFADLDSGRRFLEGLSCSGLPSVRLERIGGKYAVRVGFWSSKERALSSLEKLKGRFRGAVLRRCLLKEERIEEVKCLPSKVVKTSNPNNPKGPKAQDFDLSLTLRELGYPNDMVLSGSSLSHTFYLPLLPGFKGGLFRLKMAVSSTAPPRGYFTVSVNGVPYETFKLSEVGYNPEITVPVLRDRWSSFSRITVDFNFLPEGNICESISVPSTYVIFRNSSSFSVKLDGSFTPKEVYHYLLTYRPSFSVSGGSGVDLAELAYFLASLYKRFSLYDLSFDGGGRRIVVSSGPTRLKEGVLYLNPKDLSAERFIWPLRSERFSVESSGRELLPGQPVPLRRFGFRTRTVRGVGDSSITFNLPLHLLGGKPRRLFLILRYGVQKISLESGDRLWISLYTNGNLIWSRELPGVSSLQENVIEVPDYALSYGDNSFSVVFSYYPGPGACNGAIPNPTFTLYDTTSFSYAGVEKSFPSVADFLASLTGQVGVVVKGVSRDFVLNLFKDMGYYSPGATSLGSVESPEFFVVVEPFSQLKEGEYPVRYDGKYVRIYNPLTGRTALKVKGDYSFVLFQVGTYRGVPALFVLPSGKRGEELLKELDWSSLGRLTGNVAFLMEGSIYSFHVGKKFRVEYGTETKIEYYLKKYKFVIIALLIVVITAFTVYLWRRLT